VGTVAQVVVLDVWAFDIITFHLVELLEPLAGLKHAKHIATHTSFFKSGVCVRWMFICMVKMSLLSSMIKMLEPID